MQVVFIFFFFKAILIVLLQIYYAKLACKKLGESFLANDLFEAMHPTLHTLFHLFILILTSTLFYYLQRLCYPTGLEE